MGLDMYLNKRTYVGAEYEHREVKGEVKISVRGEELPIQFKRISSITERVGYWRKANQIHNWFVENVQGGKDDCGEYYVSKEQLEQLLTDCKTVKENASIASEVLPTKSGFFFGGTDYDEYYMGNIDDTIAIIEPLLRNNETKDGDIYYSSSW
jgi:hypothetical protein